MSPRLSFVPIDRVDKSKQVLGAIAPNTWQVFVWCDGHWREPANLMIPKRPPTMVLVIDEILEAVK